MTLSSALTTFILALLPLVSASTVQFDIARDPTVWKSQLAARQLNLQPNVIVARDPITAALTNSQIQGLYSANVTVGTPPQSLSLQIDTGSSDIWVPANSASLCSNPKQGGCPNGKFNRAASSTFEVVGQGEFNISYVDGTGSGGDYFQDTFSIGGAVISKLEMGLATTTTIGTGIMGIGYNNSEANVNTGNGTIYANLPYAMFDQGIISTVAYSLWLNDLSASTGSILFGGVDTAKYSGSLVSIPVYPSSRSGKVTSFTVAWTSLSATSPSGTDQLTPSNFAQPAILDSGTTITLLPDDIAATVFQELGATVSQQLGAVIVPCALANVDGSLNYGFGGKGGPIIKVPISELVLPLVLTNGRIPTYTNGQKACQLGIQAAGQLPILLGDTFLRSAYVVYDLINNKIALAQTNFNSTTSNVVAFASSGAQIPNAVASGATAAVTQTATAVPKVGTTSVTGGSASATPNTSVASNLSAESGFVQTATSASTSNAPTSANTKSAAGRGPEPFRWAGVGVVGLTMGLMSVGAGILVGL